MSKENHVPVGQSHHLTSGGKAVPRPTSAFPEPPSSHLPIPPSPGLPIPVSQRLRVPVSPRLVLFIITTVVLLYGVIYPNLHVLVSSFHRNDQWSLSNYRDALSQSVVLESVFTSLGVSVLTVLLCALVGIPLAFLFERYSFPARRLFGVLAALPLVLPPLVGTVAFIFLCGESGILARVVQSIFHMETPQIGRASCRERVAITEITESCGGRVRLERR